MLDKALCERLFRQMVRVRLFEESLDQFYDYRGYADLKPQAGGTGSTDETVMTDGYDFQSFGMIGGAVHLSIGQEATEVGVCSVLTDSDSVVGSHRGHGHAIGKGISAKAALAELMGRATGCSGGCGGSMHLFSRELTFLGGNGIVGGQIPLALGPAFAAKYRGTTDISVAFFGDGAANQGVLYETMNLAATWQLPLLLVCENNLYANSTPIGISLRVPDIATRAEAFGMPGHIVDGQDVMAVHSVAKLAADRARAGGGTTFIEAKTYRFEGHCGAASAHQNPDECAEWKKRDPIELFRRRIIDEGVVSQDEVKAIEAEVRAEIAEAVQFAQDSPFPTLESIEALFV